MWQRRFFLTCVALDSFLHNITTYKKWFKEAHYDNEKPTQKSQKIRTVHWQHVPTFRMTQETAACSPEYVWSEPLPTLFTCLSHNVFKLRPVTRGKNSVYFQKFMRKHVPSPSSHCLQRRIVWHGSDWRYFKHSNHSKKLSLNLALSDFLTGVEEPSKEISVS